MSLSEKGQLISSLYGVGDFTKIQIECEVKDGVYHIHGLSDDVLYTKQGKDFAIFYSPTNKWYGSGDNSDGQMDIRNGKILKPTYIPAFSSFESKMAVCGDNIVGFLGLDGQVYAIGFCFGEVLHQLDSLCKMKMITVLGHQIAAIGEETGIFLWSSYQTIPINFCRDFRYTDISASKKQLLALRDDGIASSFIPDGRAPLSLCGRGEHADRYLLEEIDQVGLPPMIHVFATPLGSFLLDNHNQLWGAGENIDGSLGINTYDHSFSFVPVIIQSFSNSIILNVIGTENSTFILTEDGKLYVAGQLFFTTSYLKRSNIFIKCDIFDSKFVRDISISSQRIIVVVKEPKQEQENIEPKLEPVQIQEPVIPKEKKHKTHKLKKSLKKESLPCLSRTQKVNGSITNPTASKLSSSQSNNLPFRTHRYKEIIPRNIIQKKPKRSQNPNVTLHIINF